MRKDLKKFRIAEEGWFKNTQDRSAWRCCCKDGLQMVTSKRMNAYVNAQAITLLFQCDTCLRLF